MKKSSLMIKRFHLPSYYSWTELAAWSCSVGTVEAIQVLGTGPSWVFILWWSSAYVGDLTDWVFTGIIDHSFVLSINKIWWTIRAFLTFNMAKFVQGKQARKVLVCGDQS